MWLGNPVHLAFIAVILLLVFGAKRLPEIGRSLGTGAREFRHSVTGGDDRSDRGPEKAAAPEAPSAAKSEAAVQPSASSGSATGDAQGT